MNGRSAGPPPLSSGSEWSGFSHYQTPLSPGPQTNSRGNLISPPISGSSSGTQPRMSSGMNGRPGGPSPPNSIGARSSYGTTMSSGDAKRRQTLQMEDRLAQHYHILKRFLGQSLRDEKGNLKPNRARDKLLRLSGIQFQELSTDVYDELLRRQSAQGQQTNGPGQVPPYLLPKDNFHPKRNQARQKLATLPPPRFRDLATDVFYELERRFPSFSGRDIPRNGSPSLGPPSRAGTPNGMRGPGYAPRKQSFSGQVIGGTGILGGPDDSYGRPTAKQFQSNTIIPNKSTMVEDDDDDGLSDVYASRRDTTMTSRSTGGLERDRKAIADLETQVNDLHTKLKELDDRLHEKDSELEQANEQHKNALSERDKYSELQSDLEAKVRSALSLNENLKSELDKVRNDQAISERDFRSQIDAMASRAQGENDWRNRYEALDRSHQDLQLDFSKQEQLTNEVRQEASGFISQMKALSERSVQSIEREEQLVTHMQRLERELEDWKNRYASVKTQARAKRSLSTGMSIQPPDAGGIVQEGAFTTPGGLVKDVHLTRFQIAIDELLQSARYNEPQAVLPHVKTVAVAVRNIMIDVGDAISGNDEAAEQKHRLKSKVSATANNLITAAKNFSMSQGLSPVSLLDAAASHLCASIVELVRLVKIRPSAEQLDDDANSDIVDSPADYYGLSNGRESAGSDSTYNADNKPQLTSRAFSLARKPVLNGISNGMPQEKASARSISRGGNIEELKNFLDTRTDSLRSTLQDLVSSIRTSAPPHDILDAVASITSTTGQIIHQTARSVPATSKACDIANTLAELVEKLEEKEREGEHVSSEALWKEYVKGLPPIGFEIAREVKELGGWVEGEVGGGDFS